MQLNKTVLFIIVVVLGVLGGVIFWGRSHKPYTVISLTDYQRVTHQASHDISELIHQLHAHHTSSPSARQVLVTAEHFFAGRPYRLLGDEGEGNWCSANSRDHSCVHINQDPIYRTDQFVCNTYVQTVLALMGVSNINQYNQQILNVEYGAAGVTPNRISYYNRNNFVSADFNPVNEQRGLLRDATKQGPLKKFVRQQSTVIDQDSWFAKQQLPSVKANWVRVLQAKSGLAMAKRFSGHYPEPFHVFKPKEVSIDYIPKQQLVKTVVESGEINYLPNNARANQLITPAVVEIVRDDQQWQIGGKNIKSLIGSGILVSHLGMLYKQHFLPDQLIYRKIQCQMDNGHKTCEESAVRCHNQQGCTRTMFTHATDAYPNGYYYYQDQQRHYQCKANKPKIFKGKLEFCDRVVAMPLTDYLIAYNYGEYSYMDNPAVLGVHIEKIIMPHTVTLQNVVG